jgi:hypothetical protein
VVVIGPGGIAAGAASEILESVLVAGSDTVVIVITGSLGFTSLSVALLFMLLLLVMFV